MVTPGSAARGRTRVGIVGLGPVGRAVARAVDGSLDGYRLTALSARRPAPAQAFADSLLSGPGVLPAHEVADACDLVVECAPAAIFAEIAQPVVEQGKTLVVLSAGALLDSWHLVDAARTTGATILVPTGALLGLDAVQAAAEGVVHSVRMTTRKPLRGLLDAPYLEGQRHVLSEAKEPVRVFSGTAREAASGFPANLNVAVALALAGVGPDRTELEIWADPDLDRNTHQITVEADSASFSMSIANVPSENVKTGLITALSVVALLRKRTSALQIGT
jgi:aspartate dehydrogenase